MYRVIKHFTDLQDGGHPYNVGDQYPRDGKEVSEARIAELSGSKNRQKTPLIKFFEDEPQPEMAEAPSEPESEVISETPAQIAEEVREESVAEVEKVEETKPKRSKKNSKN